jgi:hypothetical protein
VIDAVADGNRRAAATSLRQLVEFAAPQLDQSSINELNEVTSELAGS